MKLREIYLRCKKTYGIINKFEILNVNRTDGEFVISQLHDIECLSKYFVKFEDYIRKEMYRKPPRGKGYAIHKDYTKNFSEVKEQVVLRIKSIIELCESMGMNEEETVGIDIKIPTNGDFGDFRKSIDDIDFIFSKCPFFNNGMEKMKFENVDVGSTWITFTIVGVAVITGGSILMNNIAAFLDKVMVARSHKMTVKAQELELHKSNIDSKEKEDILRGIVKTYNLAVENITYELEKITGYDINDEEERGRAEQCIQKAVNLIDKGLQIYTTIDSPKEAKALFEPLEMKYLSISKEPKLLTENKENEK